MNHSLDAVALDIATRDDPQFVVPRHPAVVGSITTAALPDGLLIDGLASRRVLRGSTVRRTLPDVLPLLDGTRTWAEIAAESGLSVDEVRPILGTLYASGLLGEGPDASASSATHAFLGRAFDATRRHESAAAAFEALAAARIAVMPRDDGAHTRFRDAIAQQGVNVTSMAAVLADPGTDPLIVAVLDPLDAASVDAAVAVREQGIPVLPVIVEDARVIVGPVSHPDHNPCPRCLALATTARGFGTDPDSPPRRAVPSRPGLLASIAPAALALEVVLHAAGVGTARSATVATVMTDAPVTTRYEFVSRRPGCEMCGIPGPPSDPPSALVYEESVAFPPARLRNPRIHQQHFEPGNIALAHEQRDFGGDEVSLPPVELLSTQTGTVTAAALATILGTAFGLKAPPSATQGRIRRWAPTGGNLGSPQAYVRVRGVHGLPDGSYAYRADRHCLQRLPGDGAEAPRAIELIVVGELYRVWKKYNTFSYRVVALDAGVAVAHVAVAASRFGLALRNQHGWDENSIATALSLDTTQQSVAAVIRIEGEE